MGLCSAFVRLVSDSALARVSPPQIYLFLWVWLVLLTTLTSLWMLYRLLTILLPPLRLYLLKVSPSRLPSTVTTTQPHSPTPFPTPTLTETDTDRQRDRDEDRDNQIEANTNHHHHHHLSNKHRNKENSPKESHKLRIQGRTPDLHLPSLVHLQVRVSPSVSHDVEAIMRTASFSDWLLLVNLARNMEQSVFSEFIREFAAEDSRTSSPGTDQDNDTEKTHLKL
ncbi:Innexin inx2 [Portunus trituberculatus]|uniref:Innexin inx2 n=1 Tax=Portunus trituberculatus TaxID=210409 RepID=A0A5B7JWC5_PORTR|nr:Innexin inx2 [Portunus trituberculatus]